ncbi:menaquinone-dependent protoporphyrinogen IX dehydrogenase [Flavobacterium nackdongense]|uniref:Protoporphyrinogen IX dehydrogenase [quinone] n=1 Tax=Flavobacterium nackdongense TaxID=2547394 RepID=A0A4P6YD37_9FLAO|nr:menaquinone-dependent protoporphyrinogen IX dehydrogenase [Flavobacterium nackdongense]QBN18290.1 menaquinone-dependent protoporphyrinogen IX dehydrogenase [Flavobacterium nackdongense]
MNSNIGILYATVDGQTFKICTVIADVLVEKGNLVQLFSIDDFNGKVADFDKFIIGASIRYGKHNPKIIEFINQNKIALDKVENAFFSVNLVARKPEKASPETNPYFIKFLQTIHWIPKTSAVFAGNLDYQKYPLTDRWMIQLIMWMTKGPTNSKAKIEYTDWDKVKEFAVLMHNN